MARGCARRLVALAAAFSRRVDDQQALYDTAARALAEHHDGGALVFLVRPGSARLEAAAGQHPEPAALDFVLRYLSRTPLRLGAGFTGRAAASGEPRLIPGIDVEQVVAMTTPEHQELVRRLGPRSLVAAPLRAAPMTEDRH